MARPVFIVDGSRTPFLKARSGPGPFTPVDLAVQCGRPLLAPASPANQRTPALGHTSGAWLSASAPPARIKFA